MATPSARKVDVSGAPDRRMVDLHCHLLPGFDGGPANLEAAVQMAIRAHSMGVACVVATPRYGDHEYRSQNLAARSGREQLLEMLRDRGALIDIGLAAECRFGQRLLRAIVTNEAPVLGQFEGSRVLLLALPERWPKNLGAVIEWMRVQKVRPLLAAPERHREVLHHIEVLQTVVAAGALLEINASALSGRQGPYVQQRARELLERGWVTVISSNAHAGDAIGAELEVGRVAAAAILGDAAAQRLVWDNPAAIAAPLLLKSRRVHG